MMLHRLATAMAAAAISTLAAAALAGAVALPLPQAPAGEAALPAVEVVQVHGCHRGIQRDYSGWHFHSRGCARTPTAPPGLYDGTAYRRHYRGPRCTYQCRHIGPVNTCQQVCR